MRVLLSLVVAMSLPACAGEGGAPTEGVSGVTTSAGDETPDQAPHDAPRGAAAAASLAPAEASRPVDPAARAMLDAHNAQRARHCAPPLTWSDELTRVAQSWADELARRGCAFEHNRTSYGENLAAGTSGRLSPEAVVEMWYREIAAYDFRRGRFSMETGHFTQVVWQGTERLGCGMSTCRGLDVWVCNYDPPGNVEGQYAAHVHPTSCR
ncbi:MAG: hypothetical protein KF901_22635 [Myxococcales bacterium]|nr:hypothetical protein [Myxococcales bacterium]